MTGPASGSAVGALAPGRVFESPIPVRNIEQTNRSRFGFRHQSEPGVGQDSRCLSPRVLVVRISVPLRRAARERIGGTDGAGS